MDSVVMADTVIDIGLIGAVVIVFGEVPVKERIQEHLQESVLVLMIDHPVPALSKIHPYSICDIVEITVYLFPARVPCKRELGFNDNKEPSRECVLLSYFPYQISVMLDQFESGIRIFFLGVVYDLLDVAL